MGRKVERIFGKGNHDQDSVRKRHFSIKKNGRKGRG